RNQWPCDPASFVVLRAWTSDHHRAKNPSTPFRSEVARPVWHEAYRGVVLDSFGNRRLRESGSHARRSRHVRTVFQNHGGSSRAGPILHRRSCRRHRTAWWVQFSMGLGFGFRSRAICIEMDEYFLVFANSDYTLDLSRFLRTESTDGWHFFQGKEN